MGHCDFEIGQRSIEPYFYRYCTRKQIAEIFDENERGYGYPPQTTGLSSQP